MAKLFLSYSRRDQARAHRFTEWLEREGHDVWRDEDDIGGGTSFSAEIEKALKDCDAVLVLWSTDSVQSAWVRDEAGYGRDAGKLIPFSLDGTEPPLGFRQFQSIDLSKWRIGRAPTADRIRHAIERVAHLPQKTAPSPRPAPSRLSSKFFQRPRIVGAAIAVVALLAVVFVWQRWPSENEIAIAVVPSPRSPDRAMAADYANVAAADMAAFLPRRFDRATVLAPDEAVRRRSGYQMQISTDPRGKAANASLTLSDEDDHTTLWSQNWSVADASSADLKAQVSASASKAALCLTDARGGISRLSQPALSLYLSGCTAAGSSERSSADLETIFDRVTKLAPEFPPAWGYLALVRSWIAEDLHDSSPGSYAAAARSARETIAAARKLSPNNAMTYDAEYNLIAHDTFQALKVLDKGAKIDPDDWFIQFDLSQELMSVGRMSDSVQAAQRAIELEPDSPFARSQYITSLTHAGEFSKAKAEIADARKKWPTDHTVDFAEFGFQYRYGDPKVALVLLPRIGDFSEAELAPIRKVLDARMDPTPTKIDDAIAALSALWPNEPQSRNLILLTLGNFGRVNQAYQLMEDPKFQPFIATEGLFRPDFASVRADPRFMRIAARLGLVRYWRQSGYWPDFCAKEKLPYDCKAEAANYPM
jgi:tetratricopeptide (TPR) repeat protein